MIEFQNKFQIASDIVFRQRESKCFCFFYCSTCNTSDQFYFRLVPETQIRHRLLIVEVNAVVVLQQTVVDKDMVLFYYLYGLFANGNTEFEIAIFIALYIFAIAGY